MEAINGQGWGLNSTARSWARRLRRTTTVYLLKIYSQLYKKRLFLRKYKILEREREPDIEGESKEMVQRSTFRHTLPGSLF